MGRSYPTGCSRNRATLYCSGNAQSPSQDYPDKAIAPYHRDCEVAEVSRFIMVEVTPCD